MPSSCAPVPVPTHTTSVIMSVIMSAASGLITGRVSDPSLFLAPIMHRLGWRTDDWERLGRGTLVGHLMECGMQITGGYFADPGRKDVPHLARCGYPIAEVADDGTATSRQVAQVLTAGGWNAVVLRLPSTTTGPADSPQAVQLADWSEASIQAALATIEATYGPIGGYVQMTPAGAEEMFNQADKTVVKFGFLMAKHLKARLMQGNGTGRKCFVSVTRMDGALGTTSTTGGTITGGLFGLIKTLSLEWEGVFCRAIDIAPDTGAEQVANLVAAELRDPNRLVTEVAYGARGRVTLVTRKPFTNGDC